MVIDPISGEELRVLDVHHHLATGELLVRAEPYETRCTMMRNFGIDQAVVLPPSGAFSSRPSMEALNDITAEVVATDPDRFPAGLACLDPNRPVIDQLSEFDRAIDGLALRGVVWHHRFDGVWLDHESMPIMLKRCADNGVPAFIHVVGESALEAAWRLDGLLRSVPDVAIVALDAFSSHDRGGQVMELCRRWSNLYCELGAMSSAGGHQMTSFVSEFGAHRLLLGTDLYVEPLTYHSPHPLLEVLHSPMLLAEKRLVLRENAIRMLKIL